MPIYTFRCLKCKHIFDMRKCMSDDSLPCCEKCFNKTEKIISCCSFALVGGGWASDGYSRDSSKEK